MDDERKRAQRHGIRRDAERAVLGTMIRFRLSIDDVLPILSRAECFGFDAHQRIFNVIIDLHADAKPIDLVFLAEELQRRNLLSEVGGAAYLSELWDAAPTTANVEYYARLVLEHHLFQMLGYIGDEVKRDAANPPGQAGEVISSYGTKLALLAESGTVDEPVTLQDALRNQLTEINARAKDGNRVGLPTGYDDLDQILVGLQRSELVIVGARPSVGKTSLGTNIARNVCRAGGKVFFASLEQSRNEISERLICCEGRVDSYRLRTGKASADDLKCVQDAGDVMSKWKMWIDDRSSQSAAYIAANTRRLKRKSGLDVIFVDYLQLVESEDRRANRYEQVGAVTRRLKQLARELRIPIVAMCQVGRGAEDGTPPKLSDLRESGNIEQDADVVLLMHRNVKKNGDKPNEEPVDDGVIHLEVAKQRNGRRGKLVLLHEQKYTRFENHTNGIQF